MGERCKNRRMFQIPLISLLMIAILTGCNKTQTDHVEKKEEEKMLVGFSMATLKEDRWLRDRDIFIAKAKQEGIDVIVKNANNDSNIQLEQVKEMVRKGIDILVIVPNDSEEVKECIEVAKSEEIPVISYDRLARNSDVDVYISFDNVKVGELQGRYLAEHVPEGGYIILNGAKDDFNSEMFHEGYMNVLQKLADEDKIQILEETWVDNWTRETAYDFVIKGVNTHGNKVRAILAANDSLALGAIDALSVSQMTNDVVVVGHDADLIACQRIVKGTQALTIYKPITKLIDKTVEVCKQLLVDARIDSGETINDGTYDVPYIKIDVVPVTKDNIDDTIIKDGFHLKEEVYNIND
ncbi:xylose-binding protein [Mobilisporobacter senegalensis]|uniref:Xylose-binding protein n=1 Tax=Mobilisporobacter senegalensis TaxID=1329262 RepID=A0A3N1XZ71_9FIRM|nr:substrate-binding domain-containing protein [Mobilisporobacter senegalensis]ROR31894.1 xylose-binding protein [Mobilisporobacter senegalensis]